MVMNMLLLVLSLSGASSMCDVKPDLFISAPKSMEVLSGSCVRIPCRFRLQNKEEFDSSKTSFGVWIKSDSRFRKYPQNVIFNSSGTVKTYPMHITGNLGQKNCTTLFSNLTSVYTEKYFFRLENGDFKATASCNSTQITVKDSPPSPRIQTSHQELKEKESVTITCSALTPCPHSPPKLTWNLQQDAANNMVVNPDQTFTTKIRQIITVSDQHDGFNISCSAAYPVDEGRNKTAETNIALNVSYAPKNTLASISPSGSLCSGMWVNLTCSSRAKPPVSNFTWFKTSTHGPIRVSEGDVYSFNLTDGTEGGYYCEVTNDLGKKKSSVIHVNIEAVSSSSLLVAVIGGIIGLIVLICVVIGVWRLKSKHLTSEHPQSIATEDPGTTTAKEDTIHYGQINFSKCRPDPQYESVQEARGQQQQETVYAYVKVSKTDHSSDIYAQVKK